MSNVNHNPEPNDFLPPPEGLVPRPADFPELRAHFEETHEIDKERRRWVMMRVNAGWAAAGVFFVYSVLSTLLVLHRPVPRDRFMVAIMHDNGTYTPPREYNDLTADEKAAALDNSLSTYISLREGYSYASSEKAYHTVSAMSFGAEQSRYQDTMLSATNPDNPRVKYGKDGMAEVTSVKLIPDGPNAMTFQVVIKELSLTGNPVTHLKTGHLTFFKNGKLPWNIRQQFDPAGVSVLQYESHEDATTGGKGQ